MRNVLLEEGTRWVQFEKDGWKGGVVAVCGDARNTWVHRVGGNASEVLEIAAAWLKGAWTRDNEMWALPCYRSANQYLSMVMVDANDEVIR